MTKLTLQEIDLIIAKERKEWEELSFSELGIVVPLNFIVEHSLLIKKKMLMMLNDPIAYFLSSAQKDNE